VITQVRIESLRGIRTGLVEGLEPLSVLVGPNNSGKSTVLDALLIGAHPVPRAGIGHVVRRRGTVERGVRWLFWRSGNLASVAVKTSAGVERQCKLERQPQGDPSVVHVALLEA
jgi:predicted ATPase